MGRVLRGRTITDKGSTPQKITDKKEKNDDIIERNTERVLRGRTITDNGSTPQKITDKKEKNDDIIERNTERVLRSRMITDKGSTPQKITDINSESISTCKQGRLTKPREKIKNIAKNNITPESTRVIEILQGTSNQRVNDLEITNDDFRTITDTTDNHQQEIFHAVQSKTIVPNIENDGIIHFTNTTVNDNAPSTSQLVPPKSTNDIIMDTTDITENNNVQYTSSSEETSSNTDSDIEITRSISNVKKVKTKIDSIFFDSSDEENTTHQQPIERQTIGFKPKKKPLGLSKLKSIPASSTKIKKKKRKYKISLNRKQLNEFMQKMSTENFKGLVVEQKINHHLSYFQNIEHNATVPENHEPPSLATSIAQKQLRPIIIDGLNIGHAHGGYGVFSAKGIDLCVKYFANRGHTEITAFIPQHRQGPPGSESNEILIELDKKKHICFTPSRKVQNERMTCYDDRILLDYAYRCGGVVVSNDNYRDLYEESDAFKDVIENRQVMVTFVRDEILVPEDQYNRRSTVRCLSEILCFP